VPIVRHLRVSELDGVVEDDPVRVVDDLGFVAKLDRLAQLSFAYRTSIDILQANQPVRRFGHYPGQAAAGLRHDFLRTHHHGAQVVDRLGQSASTDPLAVCSTRFALQSTAVASSMAASAMPASSPV